MATRRDNDYEVELASMSTRMDGRSSIEHQIDIHVLDLIQIEHIPEISLDDVLQGLKYVMDYRIKNGKMPNLDAELMKRLLGALLRHMRGREKGRLLHQKPTAEADLAFAIFGDFLEEVYEFRMAVAEKSAPDLRHALKIHRRCQPSSTQVEKELAASILSLLTNSFPQFSDWRELVKECEHDDVQKLIAQFKQKFDQPSMPSMPPFLYPPQVLYFDKSIEKLAEMYGTSLESGLTLERYAALSSYYGPNKIPDPPKPSIFKMLLSQITDFIIIILIVVTVVEFALREYPEATILLAVVVINVIIGFTQEYKSKKALDALCSLSVPKASVIRGGVRESLDSVSLVPGDLVVLEEGDAVPADLRLVECSQLEIVEAVLTGESVPTSKATKGIRKRTRKLPLGDCKGNAFMTTVVAKGRGKGIVVRIGTQSEIGRISEAIVSQPHQLTTIQKKLSTLGKWLVGLAFFLCAVIVAISYGWGISAIESVKIGITLGVSVIPEGLVAVTTVTMAIGVTNMARLNAIVRKLASVESLGSVNVICSDKTGTLTEGKMGTSEIWTSENSLYTFTHSTSLDPSIGAASKCNTDELTTIMDLLKNGGVLNADRVSNEKAKAIELKKTVDSAPPSLVISCMIAGLCNNAGVTKDEKASGDAAWKPIGDPTEVAMVVATQKAGFSKEFFHNEVGLLKLCEYSFDSERKMMSVIYQQGSNSRIPQHFSGVGKSCFVFAKGAPEGILSNCTHYLPTCTDASMTFNTFLDGVTPAAVDEEFLELVSQRNRVMAEEGLRVLALAMRKIDIEQAMEIQSSKKSSSAETQLVFVGLIGLIDPPKEGVSASVESCKRAGIKVIMITGDHIATATAIAKQLGIYESGNENFSRSMRGAEVDLLSEDTLSELHPFPVVFARVSPDNKLKIVKALQSKKLSVAMTGDGVNDAPAIKKADVGVAMGIGGTEITKQAADIVLADDNFTTIVAAVKEGRRVFDNIKKFIVYLLACNSAEIYLFLFSSALNLPVPFDVRMILWANIIADIPPAMSLGVEPCEEDIMDRPPRPESEGVMTRMSAIIVLCEGMIQALLTLAVYIFSGAQPASLYQIIDPSSAFLASSHPHLADKQSLAFAVLVSMQLLQSFYSKSVTLSVITTGVTSNKWMIRAFFLSYILLVAGFYVPGLSDFLTAVPITGYGWAAVVITCLIQLVLVEIVKLISRRFVKKNRKIISVNTKEFETRV